MAKTAANKTPIQKAADAARANFQKAKEANEKLDNAATKKALADAQAAMRTAVEAENVERFKSVATSRTKKARAAIRQLVKVTNPKTYSSTPEQRENILKGLEEAFNDVKKAFGSVGAKAAENSDGFAL